MEINGFAGIGAVLALISRKFNQDKTSTVQLGQTLHYAYSELACC